MANVHNRPQTTAAQPHVSIGAPIRGALSAFVWFLGFTYIWYLVYQRGLGAGIPVVSILKVFITQVILQFFANGIRVTSQWERAIVLRLGQFSAIKGPGVIYILPIIDSASFIDVRTTVLNIPQQKVITKDNVPASIDAALFFRVEDGERAVMYVQDYAFAITQEAQAALRDTVGGLTLDELLSEREEIQKKIQSIVANHSKNWGLIVESIRLQDIELPEELKKMMSRQASAEREKRATITKSEGDVLAAKNLAEAAQIMSADPITLNLRSLQTIDALGSSPSNTIVLFPAQFGDAFSHMMSKKTPLAEQLLRTPPSPKAVPKVVAPIGDADKDNQA